jgi:hypothetical protein
MATKAEIQAQIDVLSAELQGADDDDEVWVEENGRRVQFKGSKATGILNKFKDLWEEPAGDGDRATAPATAPATATALARTTSLPAAATSASARADVRCPTPRRTR